VNDGLLDSAVSQVSVTAATINSAPVADAGPDQEVATGSMVILDGSGSSDADNDDLTYLWNFNSIPDGSSASLSLANSVAPTFTADVDGTYVINLVVNDGLLDSAVSQVSVTAATINSAPVADAGPTQNVATGDLVFLDGSRSSDADNDPLTYSWAVITVAGVNGVTLTGGDTVNPSFIAVDPGSYVFGLTVNDGELDSFPDSVTINSRP
ncbi:MAG TPA: PKD domain-containing protein, partial [Geopsychrobacteraceae bacterium]|nr:PKD domain-containing protein [Geopsychrobacteraceae bacterium]